MGKPELRETLNEGPVDYVAQAARWSTLFVPVDFRLRCCWITMTHKFQMTNTNLGTTRMWTNPSIVSNSSKMTTFRYRTYKDPYNYAKPKGFDQPWNSKIWFCSELWLRRRCTPNMRIQEIDLNLIFWSFWFFFSGSRKTATKILTFLSLFIFFINL